MKLVVLFPGQGAQYSGMGQSLYKEFPEARAVFDAADAALGFSLSNLMFHGSAEELQLTEHTQPAVLTHSIAAWQVLRTHFPLWGAEVAAGLSLGEYSALVAADVIDFPDALHIVKERGIAMQTAVPVGVGSMAAVLGLDTDKLEEIVQQVNGTCGVLAVANYNTPGQIVISGHNEAVEAASELLKSAGASRIIPLPVSAPFHCSLLHPAADRLRDVLADIKVSDFKLKVIANVTADYYPSTADVKDLLVRQVTNAVRWEQGVRKLLADGYDTLVELGPGSTLGQFVRRTSREMVIKVNLANFDKAEDLDLVKAVVGSTMG